MSAPEPPGSDDELLAALARAVARFDPPPSELTAANRALLTWRDPDAALAELVADSRQLAGAVRGPTDEVVLRFASDEVSLVVQLEEVQGAGRRLIGQVEGDATGSVVLRRPGGERSVPTDEWGRFQLDDVQPGPASFRWTPAGPVGRSVDTAWILI
jgi:hypothetical protein